MHVSTNFGEEIQEKKSPGTNGLIKFFEFKNENETKWIFFSKGQQKNRNVRSQKKRNVDIPIIYLSLICHHPLPLINSSTQFTSLSFVSSLFPLLDLSAFFYLS